MRGNCAQEYAFLESRVFTRCLSTFPCRRFSCRRTGHLYWGGLAFDRTVTLSTTVLLRHSRIFPLRTDSCTTI